MSTVAQQALLSGLMMNPEISQPEGCRVTAKRVKLEYRAKGIRIVIGEVVAVRKPERVSLEDPVMLTEDPEIRTLLSYKQ
jgi:hypothetical protein